MRRRTLLGLLGGTVLAGAPALGARAQTAPKVVRIGFFEPGTRRANQRFIDALRDGLRANGWIDGENAVVLDRWGDAGPTERVRAAIDELLAARVDVLVVASTIGTQAAIAATRSVPIVMIGVGDPVGSGFAASLARPGGNATGLSLVLPEIQVKQVELLAEAVPGVRRVALLQSPSDPSSTARRADALAALTTRGLQAVPLLVTDAAAIDRVLAKDAALGADALVALMDPLTLAEARRIGALSAARALPAIHVAASFAESGGLIAYGPSLVDQFRRAAGYVAKILGGAKPGDLPIEQPSAFELVINLKTARALGLTISPALLARADAVIE